MVTKKSDRYLEKSLASVGDLVSQIIIADDSSQDKTVSIAQKYRADIIFLSKGSLSEKRKRLITLAKHDWILALDADEIVSGELKREIITKLRSRPKVAGYSIPYQNHFWEKSLRYGGENYRVLRLFRKKNVTVTSSLVHEKYEILNGKIGRLNSYIIHYSYQSIGQIFSKFTRYAILTAKDKWHNKERASLKKLFLYPLHMFYARFIKDKGYRDGFFRLPVDIGFAYMEFLSYFLLFFYQIYRKK